MMFRFFKKQRHIYCDYYIVLNGEQNIQILGITGMGLKKVPYEIAKKHKGLKYWITSEKFSNLNSDDALRRMSCQAREDIMNLILGKPTRRKMEIKV